MQRRSFLKISGATGGGLLIAGMVPISKVSAKSLNGAWQPNFWMKIAADNQVTFICTQLEMGQGTSTGLSQILADELGAEWSKLKIEYADGDQKYADLQDTGGSNGLPNMWAPLRNAAAATREVLIKAAASRWDEDPADCYAEDGYIIRRGTNKKFTLGELSAEASELTPSDNPEWKPRSQFKYIGKSLSGQRQKTISTGQTKYSIDVKLPDMLYAVIERSPVVGGTLISFEDKKARKVKGVVDIYSHKGNKQEDFVFKGGVRDGVVVVANSTWAAMQAKSKLEIVWDDGPRGKKSSEDSLKEQGELMSADHERDTHIGDVDKSFDSADVKEFEYKIDCQANACMEPLNAVAHYKGNSIEVWSGTQSPQLKQDRIAEILEMDIDKVTVHAYPSGGGFGRRYFSDYTEEAVLVSKRMNKPIKLMWTREDTIRTSRYHHLRLERFRGALDSNKRIIASDYMGVVSKPSGYRPFPYDIPNRGFYVNRVGDKSLHLSTSWRSVTGHHWIFSQESFMDEMAYEAGIDPVQFRYNHLNDNEVIDQKSFGSREDLYPSRVKKVLEVVADKGNWGRNMPSGSGQGVATSSYNTSYCALLAEVTVRGTELKVDKVVAAIDCGFAINPSQVKAQVEGSIMWGLSAVYSKIDIVKGRTIQSNYHDYKLPRIDETPEIEVHIIENDFAPSGSGEPAVPVTAPAVLNAIFAATGKRLRRIPVMPEHLA